MQARAAHKALLVKRYTIDQEESISSFRVRLLTCLEENGAAGKSGISFLDDLLDLTCGRWIGRHCTVGTAGVSILNFSLVWMTW
ncbi:MAG: hypothetical protein IH612_09015 [Desulfofustis sp.]|nr:hypothetical protein [Desulfofustis sp.]